MSDRNDGGFEATTGQTKESANWLLGGAAIGVIFLLIGACYAVSQIL